MIQFVRTGVPGYAAHVTLPDQMIATASCSTPDLALRALRRYVQKDMMDLEGIDGIIFDRDPMKLSVQDMLESRNRVVNEIDRELDQWFTWKLP